ncbi:hypothetical protein FRB96_009053 [Tulasnella sp. 330]|nr:hypothetical protein FRB96_009053 [Tulasnella sp. 330]
MPSIPQLTDLQKGTIWGEYAEVFLLGIYTCLVVVTLRAGLRKGRLHLIGWFIIVVHWLTICRVALGLYVLYRVMFIDGGSPANYQITDYVLHGIRQGCTLVTAHLADSLFIWRLYVIWSRNVRIVLLPMFLFSCSATGAVVIVTSNFFLAKGPLYAAIHLWAPYATLAVVIVNTCYVTVLVASRLWWMGRMLHKMESSEKIRKSRYQGTITALVQSGSMYTIAVGLCLMSGIKRNIAIITVTGDVTAVVVGISATLLVLVRCDSERDLW